MRRLARSRDLSLRTPFAILERPALFALVGVANTVIDCGAYLGLTRLLGAEPLVANALGYLLGSAHGYVANGKLTFRHARVKLLAVRPIAAFAASSAVSLLAATAAMAAFLTVMHDLVAKLLTVGVTFAVNYGLGRTVVYRARRGGAA